MIGTEKLSDLIKDRQIVSNRSWFTKLRLVFKESYFTYDITPERVSCIRYKILGDTIYIMKIFGVGEE